jgi:hypothetical protein
MKRNDHLAVVHRLVDNTYAPADQKGTFSLKPSLQGNMLALKFMTVVHFAGERPLEPQTKQCKEQAAQLFNDSIRKLREDYKQETNQTLKVKALNTDYDFEMLQATASSLRKVAYFRATQIYDLTQE